MRNRYLSVPLNETGIYEYDHGVEDTENILEMILTDVEFDRLVNDGVFDKINESCGLLIDDYESEIIPAEDLRKCLFLIEGKENSYPIFSKMVEGALLYNTFLALDF